MACRGRVPSDDDHYEEDRPMDSDRFDRLARTLGQTRSRRQALWGLAGAATAALALGGREASAGTCKGKGKACTRNRQCCSKKCRGGTCKARCGVLPPRA